MPAWRNPPVTTKAIDVAMAAQENLLYLKARGKALRDQILDFQKQVATVDSEFSDQIVKISQRETHAIVRMMQDRLPQELQRLIYEHYWISTANPVTEKFLPVGETSPNGLKFITGSAEYIQALSFYRVHHEQWLFRKKETTWETLPTLILPAFVGKEAAKDATLEIFALTPAFCVVRWTQRFFQLRYFLSHDVFNNGVTPASFIREIPSAHICDSLTRFDTKLGRTWADILQEIKAAFKALLHIRLKQNFRLKMSLKQYSTTQLEQILEAFRKVYVQLVRDGVDISIEMIIRRMETVDIVDYYVLPRPE